MCRRVLDFVFVLDRVFDSVFALNDLGNDRVFLVDLDNRDDLKDLDLDLDLEDHNGTSVQIILTSYTSAFCPDWQCAADTQLSR